MNAKPNETSFQPDNSHQLRNAFGQFATGVTAIVTRDQAGGLVGLTVNSFTSVSLDPPLILWNLRQGARSYRAFKACDYFVINVLASDQIEVARKFSAPHADRFAGMSWVPSPVSSLPIFAGVSAWFECKALNSYDAGDHTIFVAEVRGFSHAKRPPLLFHGGAFVQSHPPQTT